MQSWSLGSFIEEYGVSCVTKIWGVSRQTVYMAKPKQRVIKVVMVDGNYEIWETRLLNKAPCDQINLGKRKSK